MSEQLRLVPPGVDFDPPAGDELMHCPMAAPAAAATVAFDRRSPFAGYTRLLTPEGGVLISYVDQNRSLRLTVARVAGWGVATGVGGWEIFFESSLSWLHSFAAFAALALIAGFIANLKIKVPHSVEIRPDCMIVDGEDVFLAEEIGDHWPALQMKDEDPDRMVISGICGTRRIEYMTANRLDKADSTPEVLAADLQAAIEQLWGRREVTFETAP
ncbi:hypothetical protein [Bradyrhizobium iriomotense]|uniref:Uncharacterized protein n=1 Tax=Bradyrhizobium iriomotense TaxID=441950 RepID=A0ABQ6B6S0_9BRAD|nr:hypothetical protein [Bradyrhizobium iriomotense]GLR89758.1 hypothetical protein GCM10007857_64720 [Bradyrhizobium iriomotense]